MSGLNRYRLAVGPWLDRWRVMYSATVCDGWAQSFVVIARSEAAAHLVAKGIRLSIAEGLADASDVQSLYRAARTTLGRVDS